MIIQNILEKLGDTPVVQLAMPEQPLIKLFAKLEFYNPTGSVKDRAANYIIRECLASGVITRNTILIESSSGNFGVALAAYARLYGLKFICVVDPNISEMNEFLIRSFNATIVKVTTPDEFGGFLLTRIKKVRELAVSIPDVYWVNQYHNPLNAKAYYDTLGAEICNQFRALDYLFVGVSSGGTITGLSQRIKHHYPGAKVIAVDSKGSVIFKNIPKKRYIPGIGSSMRPSILQHASIDDYILVDEFEAVKTCNNILKKYSIWAGGSSGSVLSGIQEYFNRLRPDKELNVLAIFPDKGEKYAATIYNPNWCENIWAPQPELVAASVY